MSKTQDPQIKALTAKLEKAQAAEHLLKQANLAADRLKEKASVKNEEAELTELEHALDEL